LLILSYWISQSPKIGEYKMKRIALAFVALTLACSFSALADDDAGKKPNAKMDSPEAVETRIKELHTKLKITDAQEDLWKTVSQEMRDSGKAMRDLSGTREEKTKTMTAIDDLNSYAEIATLHAESMKKFVSVFTPLYNNMSDDQKKNADEIFRGHKDSKRKQK
jgi:periplasmic protein CpxP/Spy